MQFVQNQQLLTWQVELIKLFNTQEEAQEYCNKNQWRYITGTKLVPVEVKEKENDGDSKNTTESP